jgi:hypothetical protein
MLLLEFDPAGKVPFGEVLSQRPSMASQPTDLRTSKHKQGSIGKLAASLFESCIQTIDLR